MSDFKKAQAMYDNAGLPDDPEVSDSECGATYAIAYDLDLSEVMDAIATAFDVEFSVSLSECVLSNISEKISALVESELADALLRSRSMQ